MSVFTAYSSGSASEDNTRLARAVTLAKVWGDGATVFIDTVRSKGTFNYTTLHCFENKAINLDATQATRLIRASSAAGIFWGTDLAGAVTEPWNMTTGNVDAITAGASTIANPGVSLSDGDWVLLYSDNSPSDHTPHTSINPMRVCELHQVNRRTISGTPGVNTTTWHLNRPIYDTMNSNQKISKLTTIHNVRISNLQIEMASGQTPAGSALRLVGCIDFVMTDVRLGNKQGKNNPGEVTFIYCKGRQNRCHALDHQDPNTSQATYYGFTDSICAMMHRTECEFGSIRHGFTSAGRERTVSGTTYRYGGTLDGVFDNCTWYGPPRQNPANSNYESMPQWSDHSECARYTVKNSKFYLTNFNAAFLIRGRDITFDNNEFVSTTAGNIGYVRAARFSFINNRIKGGFRIEVSNGGTQANVDNIVFQNNKWRDTYGCCLAIFTGNNIDVSDNHFHNCGAGVAGSPFSPKCLIYIASLTDSNAKIRINGNTAPKYSNDYFVYASAINEDQLASFSGNKGLETYTRCGLGFARNRIAIAGVYDPSDTEPTNYVGGIGQPIDAVPLWEMKYAVSNGRDKFKYVKKLGHGLTAADVDCPITTGCEVYDHTAPDQVLDGWLGEVINDDWFVLFPSQSTFEVDDDILGETYSPETQTRALWWNGTTRKLMTEPPEDNAVDARTIVRVNAMAGNKLHLTFDYLPDSAISGGGNGGGSLRVLGTNMADNQYYNPARPLVNQAKWLAPFVVGTLATWDTGGSVSVDANGFPTGFSSPTVCNTVMMMYGGHPNGTWTLTWDGPANAITVDGATNNSTSCVITKNTTNQTFIVRLRASGITAIRCTHSSDNIGQTFTPAFVTKCQKYKLLRLMNWCNPNYIGWTPNWATRKTLNSYTASRASTTVLGVPQQIYEMPWEYCYQIGNAASRDIWVCFHHLASDSYIQSACQLIHAGLSPGLKVYVEHSNETWNSAFPSRQYCIDSGDGTDTDPVRRGFIFHMDRTAAIGNIAKANMPGRTVKTVMGVQSAGGVGFWDYAASKIKPASLAAIDVISPAPYFGNYVASSDALRDAIVTGWNTSQAAAKDVIFSQIRTHLDAVDGPYAQMSEWRAKTVSLGKELIAYEGGQHLALRGVDYASYAANVGQAMILANQDSRMGDMYEEYLEQWYLRSGGQIMCHYTDVFTPQQLYGAWGAQEYEGESTSTAFKYAAILAHTGQTA